MRCVTHAAIPIRIVILNTDPDLWCEPANATNSADCDRSVTSSNPVRHAYFVPARLANPSSPWAACP
jgi:hypothetical protein